ncbi:MAG: DUF6088 family protein [Pseudomonadota bacterium]
MQGAVNKIINRIYGNGRGWCFTPGNFSDLGTSEVVRKALSRLEKQGLIRRLAHGIYDYPQRHIKLGVLPPDIQKVAKAISDKYKIQIQVSGAYAANLIGISKHVPGKIVYLTDGRSMKYKIGNLELIFKRTTPKNMKKAGSISGIVIAALRFIGKDNVNERIINILKNNLSDEDKKRLKLDASLAPVWISKIINDKIYGGLHE